MLLAYSSSRESEAEALVADLFEVHGWQVDRSPKYGDERPDLLIRKGRQLYVVEVKALGEGRADRAIPILSQAILQAQAQAHAFDGEKAQPLAVISVEHASQSLTKSLASFVERYAPNVAVGLVSNRGLRYFRGAGLDEMNAEPEQPRWNRSSLAHQPVNLFSDLNQWMLKVLLAPEIPDHLLHAPRQKYQSGAELADAADVSAMSASRFLQQLRSEGYLDDSARHIALVRREDLFRRWQAAAMRPSPELPMRFLIRGAVKKQIQAVLTRNQGESCLALFWAAEALGLGHVSGVPPYVYVPKLPQPDDKIWKALLPVAASEVPDVIVRQALTPKSVFRGAVHHDGLNVSDVIQVWLDVGNHPSRGDEQANLIYEKFLRQIVDG